MTPFVDIVDFVDKLILLVFLNVSLEMGKMVCSLLLIATNDMFRYCVGLDPDRIVFIDNLNLTVNTTPSRNIGTFNCLSTKTVGHDKVSLSFSCFKLNFIKTSLSSILLLSSKQ